MSPTELTAITDRLQFDVRHLAIEIGPRNIHHYPALCRAAHHIERAFCEAGYVPTRQTFEAMGKGCANIIAEKPGLESSREVFVVGAHYDTHKESPGANDNGSGIAALLELARAAAGWRSRRTIRFVAFTNEESPFTRTRHMGSCVYAEACRKRGDEITGMLCLETLGCYSEERAQRLSFGGLLLPRRADFLALVGNLRSRRLLHRCSEALGVDPEIKFRALSLPGGTPRGAELGPLVLLEKRLPSRHGNRYGATAIPALSPKYRYARQDRFRLARTRGKGPPASARKCSCRIAPRGQAGLRYVPTSGWERRVNQDETRLPSEVMMGAAADLAGRDHLVNRVTACPS